MRILAPSDDNVHTMALPSTMYNFTIGLSHVDRGVYETLAVRAARHPSESEGYLAARVLAYALEYTEGIQFAPGGLSDTDAPAVQVRDLTGAWVSWIEIGNPDPARLHKAAKAAPRVAVYTHKDPHLLLRQLAGQKIHQAERIEIYSFDPAFLQGLLDRLDRRMNFELSVSDGQLYLDVGGKSFQGALTRHAI